jgi:hypothetical protein
MYANEKSWNVFPVRPNKKPYTPRGYLDATRNPKQIEEWWDTWPDANIGFSPGDAELLVFDIDPGATIDTLNKALDGYLPDTELAARTPRGGHHLYFKLNGGETVRPSASQVAKHIDVRSSGSYVLLPPSKTDAGEYKWVGEQGPKARPARRTDAMMQVVKQKRQRDPHADQWLVTPDQPENIAACISWLKEVAQPAIEGQGGDLMTYKTAAMCRSYGIEENTALDLMLDHWNDRCDPPWQHDDLHLKVRNAYEYPTSPAGNVTAEGRAKQLGLDKVELIKDEDGFELTVAKMRIVDRKRMNAITEPDWLIDDVLPYGTTIMYAPPSSYKTFIALDMALSVAAGDTAVDPVHKVVSSGPVLFMLGEGRSHMLRRVKAWEEVHHWGVEVPDFYLGDPTPNVAADYSQLFEQMRQQCPQGVRLAVIDTVSRSLQGENENTQEIATKFTKLCDQFRMELGCAVLAIHHTGKTGEDIRGSSVFRGDADALYRCDKPNDHIVSLRQEKIKDGIEWTRPKQIGLSEVGGTLVAVTPTAEHRALFEKSDGKTKLASDVLEDLIIEACQSIPGHVWSANALAEHLAEHDDVEVGAHAIRKRLKMIKGNPSAQLLPYVSQQGFGYQAD